MYGAGLCTLLPGLPLKILSYAVLGKAYRPYTATRDSVQRKGWNSDFTQTKEDSP